MASAIKPLVVNGWSIYAHPLFLDQIEELAGQVEAKKRKAPKGYRSTNCAKRLAAIHKLVTGDIPADPGNSKFRQGSALGARRKHWFRAKFFQQYRLFFRFDSSSKVIVLAWVNDEKSLRSYGSKTDAYAEFKKALDKGNPPDDFNALLREAALTGERLIKTLQSK